MQVQIRSLSSGLREKRRDARVSAEELREAGFRACIVNGMSCTGAQRIYTAAGKEPVLKCMNQQQDFFAEETILCTRQT